MQRAANSIDSRMFRPIDQDRVDQLAVFRAAGYQSAHKRIRLQDFQNRPKESDRRR
jgi:hypothetical protein